MPKIAKVFLLFSAILIGSQTNADATQSDNFYTSIKVGGGFNKLKIADTSGNIELNKKAKGLIGTLALGYRVQDNVRLETELYMDNGIQAKRSGDISKAKKQTYAGFVNAYLDLSNSTDFVPYAMIGVGAAATRTQFTDIVSSIEIDKYKGKRSWGFAAQAGVGVYYKLSTSAELDISYRALHNKNKHSATAQISGVVSTFNVKSNLTQIGLVGLRLNF